MVVATRNITNAALLALVEVNLGSVVDALGDADFVELGPETMVVHRRRRGSSS